jgi:hypothetical protein
LPVAAETVTVGPDTWTFVAVDSGPFQVAIGADANATGANLAVAITSESTISVSASNVGGVVTLTAPVPGASGDAIALAEAATNVAVSGAALAGGMEPLIGLALGKDDSHRREPFEVVDLTGEVYVRIDTPPASSPASTMHFGVVRDEA